jgi:hypothetical protein
MAPMSDDDRARWQPQERGLGRLCEACGAPLREGDTACPACGWESDGAAPRHWGMLTPFGYGLCAFIGAGLLGAALASALRGSLPREAVVLGPVALAAVAAWLAAQVGRRLSPQLRCSYEHLLISGMIGGPAGAMAALAGLQSVEGLLLVWAGATAATYLVMRRYGYRARDVR